jgi:hypothetical protein
MPATIRIERVREAVENLLNRKTHPAFAGYLALCEDATLHDSVTNLRPNFKAFFDNYLAVPGGPEGRPYYRPFWHQGSSRVKAWYQSNVAGSFSPRSALRISNLMRCIDVDDIEGMFSLKSEHQALALEHLALGTPIEILDVAVYLLREYQFDDPAVTTHDLIDEFANRFFFKDRSALDPIFIVPSRKNELVDVFSRS